MGYFITWVGCTLCIIRLKSPENPGARAYRPRGFPRVSKKGPQAPYIYGCGYEVYIASNAVYDITINNINKGETK